MKKILLLGAGKSSNVLVRYLLANAEQEDWQLTIGDMNVEATKAKFREHTRLTIIAFNLSDEHSLAKEVEASDLVISMLPADFHPIVAKACVDRGVHMVTASYVSEDMKRLHQSAKDKGVLLLNEIGVDPGIDHMSAMQVIERIKADGGIMTGFESFTGGLLAPETEMNNPWKYKFTWNPRNVVLAGQGTVKFLQEGKYKYIPYRRLFRRTEVIHIPEYGYFEGYGNRDSLKYRSLYGLDDIRTIYRGTLRRVGFSKTWNVFVQLGATDDTYIMENTEEMTYREFINSFLYYHPTDSVELKLAHYLNLDIDAEEMFKLTWLGIFEEKKVGLKNATPAQVLQKILEDKWTLGPNDKDMIVMWHKFNFTINGEPKELHASMVATGENTTYTAMAQTVGLPVGIAVKLILQGTIALTGVVIPTIKEVYEPVLTELEKQGIEFKEMEVEG